LICNNPLIQQSNNPCDGSEKDSYYERSPLVNTLKTTVVAILLILAFWFGYKVKTYSGNTAPAIPARLSDTQHVKYWTCSMHPQIREPKAGKCPTCGMDPIPAETASSDNTGKAELKLSEEAEKVVTRGNFKIDSSLQIKAGPLMMTEFPEITNLSSDEKKRSISFSALWHSTTRAPTGCRRLIKCKTNTSAQSCRNAES
jgi:hypothetical protein